MSGAPTFSPGELRAAYRSLYKASLAAVQYSSPARYTVRNMLRGAFRDDHDGPSSSSSSSSSSSRVPSKTSPRAARRFPKSPLSAPASFNATRVRNTLDFLRDAAETRGLAHKVVKGLVHTRYWDQALWKDRWRGTAGRYAVAYDDPASRAARQMHADALRGLNRNMGLCLR